MSFETDIPKHIEVCNKKVKELVLNRLDIDFGSEGHECDCEYCDRNYEGASLGDPEANDKAAIIDQEIESLQHTIKSLKAHAAVHKVQITLREKGEL